MHRRHAVTLDVVGPWSLRTSRDFWEGFAPAVLPAQVRGGGAPLHTVFRVDHDWSRAEADVTQDDGVATVVVTGDGDLDDAAAQVARFLSLDVDARTWPDVAAGDRVIADAQAQLRGPVRVPLALRGRCLGRAVPACAHHPGRRPAGRPRRPAQR